MSVAAIAFHVPGVPAPQGSKRHVGRGILVESSKALAPWRTTVGVVARQEYSGPPLDGPVRVKLTFTFPRLKRHYRANGELRDSAEYWHGSRPDVDKLARAVLDGLTGIVFRDDGQVCELAAGKRYGDNAGVDVMVLPVSRGPGVAAAA
jgi:crossover junction endodeoxyribonuclease RusA